MHILINVKHIRLIAIAAVLASAANAVAFAIPEPSESPRVEVAQQPTLKVAHGQVEIFLPGNEARQLTIFALTGQVVKTATIQPGNTVIELPAGYYIVKCDRLSQRVIVR